MRSLSRIALALGALVPLLLWSGAHLHAQAPDASFPNTVATTAAPIQVTLPDTTVQEGRSISFPIRVEEVAGEDASAYQFTLTYDPSVVNFTGIDAKNTLSSSGSISVGQSEGEIRVAYASSDALQGSGTLLRLTGTVASPGETILTFQELLFFDQNGQEISSTADTPRLTVEEDTTPPEAPGNLSVTPQDANVELNWTAPANDDVTRQLIYRGTSAGFDTTGARIQVVDSLTANFTDSAPPSGTTFYYRIAAVDVVGNISTLSNLASALSVQIDRSFADPSDGQSYQLVALPGQSGRPLAGTLSGDPNADWQAWWDNGAQSDFLVRFDGSDQFNFTAGRGFWLISTSNWTIDTTLPGADLSDGLTTTIPLHSGWNIISNPLAQDVAWSAVETTNGATLQALWQWDGGFSEASTFASASSGEAFYFLNDQNLEELVLPLPQASASASPADASASSDDGSTLGLAVHQAGRTTSRIRVGLHPDAKQGLDALDQVAPPGRFIPARAYLMAPAAPSSSRRRYLAHEWRPLDGEGQSFELILQSDRSAPVRLVASNVSAFQDREVALINPATGQSHDLTTAPSVTLQPSQDEDLPLRLVIGSAAYVDHEMAKATPERLAFRPGYPNPFRSQTTLEYALPASADVQIAIYDVLGRRVRILADGNHTAGRHEITWDGRNSAGAPVASGLYLIRLDADGQTRLQKATLLR